MPVQKVLDLSTAHMPNSNPLFPDVTYAETRYGYIVFVPGLAHLRDPTAALELAGWLYPILLKAAQEGCILINFDRDAEMEADLPTWEW
jgi:hypothetical protein